MLFGYLSNRVKNCNVNYFQFLKKLRPLWPNKQEQRHLELEREREQRLKKEAKIRKNGIHKLIFDLCRI